MPLHLELRWQASATVAESIVGRALLVSVSCTDSAPEMFRLNREQGIITERAPKDCLTADSPQRHPAGGSGGSRAADACSER